MRRGSIFAPFNSYYAPKLESKYKFLKNFPPLASARSGVVMQAI